jgi:hypothetical protein
MFSEMFTKKSTRQPTLDYFWKLTPSKPLGTKNMLAETIDKRFENFSPHYRGRVLRMSKILSLVGVMVLFFSCFGAVLLMVPHQALIAAPAYSVELSVTAKTQLPSNLTIITSEEVESLQPMKLYAIPIVSVESLNGSFTGPLSRRLESLNSTDFLVSETGSCLTIELRKVTVETTVSASGLGNTTYDQTENSAFDYLGFFRDGEIYYALAQHGFNQVFVLSLSSSVGEKSTAQKTLFSSNSSGDSALVIINIQSDIFATDNTMLISTNEDFLNEATFLIHQTKLNTSITQSVSNATEPFHVLD